ncbi:2-dehydro-3-deoxyphosphogluconate aldolase/(4S)-4-hydroxy-2-oxoglutarate aldolase [Lederbergia galactosidilyticus]|nr:2-dehydro-3-deoxyphosphogluconate aldolase/(4S)-4-hydroxy-2-oxoglutarate aldolase [Lederbergia galactosidilytica]
MMDVKSLILDKKLIAILRNVPADHVIEISKALQKGGISIIEVTLNSPGALYAIERVANELGDEILVGAGTVLDPESAQLAISAGAKFILSPTVNLETIKLTKRYGVVSIPGALTPTEILTAYEQGADMIKLFPALVGADYIKAIQGPLPFIPLLATGGVDLDNIKGFLQAGAAGFGIGGSLVNANEPFTAESLARISEKARQFVKALESEQ